ncbi:MAG: BMP family ABC transporter substrate-binding protein [Actinomycetota bacterium]|nr:MAG: basic membrane [Actinomycetota bacterium]MDO8949666.1 BMP family ABC transporter substrate-binding protein [Actinomycetota bacterium]MDP3630087.1 BMP family ABC transporter substrate-binding protein [Actinomycetota bacterium]
MNRKWTRILAIMLALVLLVAFVPGCAKKADPGTTDGGTTPPKTTIKAAMVTDVGGLGDKSFNDGAFQGLERAKAELGVEIKVLESKEITDYESNIDQLATAGFSPIFAVGFLMTDTVSKMSTAFPDVQFGGVDEFFDPVPANVVGLNFKEEQGSYLAGVVAGLATKDKFDSKLNADNVIGFVGGMDIPLIQKFEAGFIAGAKSVNPDVKVISLYAGNFSDIAKGKELGYSLIEQKADVIYAAAGAVGLGTIEACKDKGALFIGVDVDQYETVANSGDVMLTSMIKRVDNAVFETIKAVVDGKFPGGTIKAFGLAEEGVGLAPYHDFDSKIPQAIKDAVEKARTEIIAGTINVPTAR